MRGIGNVHPVVAATMVKLMFGMSNTDAAMLRANLFAFREDILTVDVDALFDEQQAVVDKMQEILGWINSGADIKIEDVLAERSKTHAMIFQKIYFPQYCQVTN